MLFISGQKGVVCEISQVPGGLGIGFLLGGLKAMWFYCRFLHNHSPFAYELDIETS